MKIFNWDNSRGQVELNIPEIVLVPEIAALLDVKRNKCKEDPEGKYKYQAFKELSYIYMMWDWTSPLCDLGEVVRQREALSMSEITQAEYNKNELLHKAERKFKSLQQSFSTYRLLDASKEIIEKLYCYFKFEVDLGAKKDDQTPVYKAKDVIAEISSIDKALESLKNAERRYKSDLDEESKSRGESTPGFLDSYKA